MQKRNVSSYWLTVDSKTFATDLFRSIADYVIVAIAYLRAVKEALKNITFIGRFHQAFSAQEGLSTDSSIWLSFMMPRRVSNEGPSTDTISW